MEIKWKKQEKWNLAGIMQKSFIFRIYFNILRDRKEDILHLWKNWTIYKQEHWQSKKRTGEIKNITVEIEKVNWEL